MPLCYFLAIAAFMSRPFRAPDIIIRPSQGGARPWRASLALGWYAMALQAIRVNIRQREA